MAQIAKFSELPPYRPARTRLGAAEGTDTSIDPKKGVMKCLLSGETGASGNFMLVATEGEVETGYHPRHAHSFDQIRYAHKGDVKFLSDNKPIREGSVAYFPAGTYYGPYDGDYGGEMISVQFEGSHKAKYYDLGSQEMRDAVEALSRTGTLKDGVYRWVDENGRRHAMDSMKALLEYIRKEPEVFPAPRFDEPVVMNPKNFAWIPTSEGSFTKELGTFTELKTTIGMIKLPPSGSHTLRFDSRITLVTVASGSITVDGHELRPKDAFRLDRDERQKGSSVDGAELLYFGLPDIAPEPVASAGAPELAAAK
jgi:hypothetical protein